MPAQRVGRWRSRLVPGASNKGLSGVNTASVPQLRARRPTGAFKAGVSATVACGVSGTGIVVLRRRKISFPVAGPRFDSSGPSPPSPSCFFALFQFFFFFSPPYFRNSQTCFRNLGNTSGLRESFWEGRSATEMGSVAEMGPASFITVYAPQTHHFFATRSTAHHINHTRHNDAITTGQGGASH